jgi:REP element-mobilizing transposase RayT
MTDVPDRHRRSIRLRNYNYSLAGAYFMTVCVQGKTSLFGEVTDGKMQLNDAGREVQDVWDSIPKYYPGIDIDIFQIMPNHIHGILIIVGAGPRACPDAALSPIVQPRGGAESTGQPQGVAPTLSLPDVMHRFKTLTTRLYVNGVKQSGWTPFRGRLWQRNYYEHVIRNEESLNHIRQYIADNPTHWSLDRENPKAMVLEAKEAWRMPEGAISLIRGEINNIYATTSVQL